MDASELPGDTAHERISLFIKAPRMIYLGHISSACILLYLASHLSHVPHWFLYLWGVVEIVGTPFALGSLTRCYSGDAQGWWGGKRRWMFALDSLFLFVGISWGAMLFISLNPESTPYFSIQMAIAAGASAAAVKSLGLFPHAFKLYSIPLLGLLSARLFLLGGDYVLLGLLVLVFLAMLVGLSKDVMTRMNEYIAIKYQNLNLAEQYRDAAAQANHANREKTRLLTAASHDMRQPIHAAALHLETLSADKFNDKDKATIGNIKQSLAQLDEMFNSVLDASLLDSGKITVSNADVSLAKIVHSIIEDFQHMAVAAGASIETEIPDITISCDPALLRRMIQNLISNAIRYGGAGKITVKTTVEGRELSISVKDTGPGIPLEDQAVIFEEFSRLDQGNGEQGGITASDQGRGLGLGLAIVKRLAALQGMTVELTSDRSGTVFKLGAISIVAPSASVADAR